MNHPFDDKDLTFGDLKKIVDLGLQGKLDLEETPTEKTDGQNLMITLKKDKLLAARNKGQIKDKGKKAMDVVAVARKFQGRGDIKDAFVFAETCMACGHDYAYAETCTACGHACDFAEAAPTHTIQNDD